MKTKLFKYIVSIALTLSMLIGTFTVYAVEGSSVADEMPYLTSEKTGSYDGTVTSYYGDDAVAAGIPGGYYGWVLDVTGKSNGAYPAVDFNFTSLNIPVADIEKITFRVYIPTGYSELRMTSPHSSASWVMRAAPSSHDKWIDVSLHSDGTGFMSGVTMNDLANSDGMLGKFALVGRLSSGNAHYYVDSITISYKAGASDDTTPPVISYEGDTDVTCTVGDSFAPVGLTAYDEYDKSAASISYEWSDGAVDPLGALNAGEHTCKVIATDRSGNTSHLIFNVTVKADSSVIRLDELPVIDYIDGVSIYNGTSVNLTDEEAALDGVPSGYTNGVTKVSGTAQRFGTTLDFSELEIPVGLIEKITLRVYFHNTTNAIRISNHGASDWVVLANAAQNTWMDYTIMKDGTGFSNPYKIKDLANARGNLGIFGLATKAETNDYTFFIDSITVTLKKDDGTAPVISYDGDTNITTSCGKPFVTDAKAYDALEERYVSISYEWSDGAVDGDGNLLIGEHVCKVVANNYYGNESYIMLNVTVGPPDTEAPVILFEARDIYVMEGTFYRCEMLAIDNYDKLTVEEKWSAGAIDLGGRLKRGEHTLTLTVTDLSGNSTTLVVNVHVTSDDTHVGHLIVQQ